MALSLQLLLLSGCACLVQSLQCISGASFSTLEMVTCDVGVNYCAFRTGVNVRQKKTKNGGEVEEGLFVDDDKDAKVAQLGFGSRGSGVWGCWKDEWAAEGQPKCDSVDASRKKDKGILTVRCCCQTDSCNQDMKFQQDCVVSGAVAARPDFFLVLLASLVLVYYHSVV